MNNDRRFDNPPRPERRTLPWYAAAGLLVFSGFVHLVVWLVEGGAWEGPLSWRKPILFGFSAGMTAASLGWVLGRCRPRTGDVAWSLVGSTALVAEVALISLQTWRGVPSHYNDSTPFDAVVHLAMDVLISVVTLAIIDLTVRTFRSFSAKPDTTLAVRGGMLFLLLACLIGYVILAIGWSRQAAGLDPSLFGRAGVLKFPHGLVIHAIQFLPLWTWLLQRRQVAERRRVQSTYAMLAACALLLVFSLVQTFSGRSRFDF